MYTYILYIHVHTCIPTCTCTCVYIIYTYMAYMYMYMYTKLQRNGQIVKYIGNCIHVHVYILYMYIHVYLHVNAHAYMYIHVQYTCTWHTCTCMYTNFPLIFHCGAYYKLKHSTYQSDCVGLSNYFLKLITTASLLHLLREELGSLRGSFTPAPSNTMC